MTGKGRGATALELLSLRREGSNGKFEQEGLWTARIGGIDEPAGRQARMLLVWVGVCFPDPRCWGWVAGWDAEVAGGHCWLGLVGCLAGGWEPILVAHFRTSANLIFPNPSILVLRPCKRRRKTPSRIPKWRGDSTFHFLSSFGTCF